jgi:hypothetical protein
MAKPNRWHPKKEAIFIYRNRIRAIKCPVRKQIVCTGDAVAHGELLGHVLNLKVFEDGFFAEVISSRENGFKRTFVPLAELRLRRSCKPYCIQASISWPNQEVMLKTS